jgi:hypothetical protein
MPTPPPRLYPATSFLGVENYSASELKTFDCANPILNKWLTQFARTSNKKGIATTVMAPSEEKLPILGYATVCASSIEKASLSSQAQMGLGSYQVSVVLIARLAISKDTQGQGLGKRFLMHIFHTVARSVKGQDTGLAIGARGVIVDAKDDGAARFYTQYGLELLSGQDSFPKRMFIRTETILDSIL